MRLQTVVETPAYLGAAKGVLTEAERIAVVNMVAENPLAGIPLGGGVRKARFGKSGRGKSGGVRIVFLFWTEEIPVFLLTVFAKNEKGNLSRGERAALTKAAKQMARDYGRRT